jgi:uncharacterized protein YaeQ
MAPGDVDGLELLHAHATGRGGMASPSGCSARDPEVLVSRGLALPATLHDFQIELANVDADVTQRVSLRAARHPSESMERLWLRVLAWCWKWREGIEQGPGLSDPDAPDVLARDLTGQTTLWVRVGRPDAVRLQQEADRNRRAEIAVLFDSPRRMEAFVEEARTAGLARMGRVAIAAVDPALLAALASSEERRAKVSVTIVGDHLYLERDGRPLDGPLHRAYIPDI